MYRGNPFGNPDGARADLKEVEHSFITDYPYGMSFERDLDGILNKRVIVGAKGSGKTVYLRKIQSILKERVEINPSIYVDNNIEQNLNCTDRVIRFCELFPQKILSEKWNKAWQITIILTIANKLLYNEKLEKYITISEKEELVKLLRNSGLVTKEDIEQSREYSIYEYFQILLFNSETKVQINKILENRDLLYLKDKLTLILRNAPEMYFFLDSIDLEYEHAPLHWLMCQKGLYYAVLSFLQEDILGEKLHLIITLRDNVFTSILRSEHNTKFAAESHVFPLIWNYPNIKCFLSQKILGLDDCYFIVENIQQKTIQTWLSISTINNEFEKEEKIEDFLIRHTRLVPRDVIIICNELAKLHAEVVLHHCKNISDRIKEIVLKNSRVYGSELLTICAKNITANIMPNGAGRYDYSEGFTANQFYHESIYTKLTALLSSVISKFEFGKDTIAELERKGTAIFGENSYVLDVLWQNNVIGYIDNETSYFYGQGFTNDILLSREKNHYILCSCVALKIFN